MPDTKDSPPDAKPPDAKPPDARPPKWAPSDAGDAFASQVIAGIPGGTSRQPANQPTTRRGLGVEDYVRGVLDGDRGVLARAITLIESNAPAHFDLAQEVLRHLLPHTGSAVRVGITGVPGAGKSTLIEALGMNLIKAGHRLAVLAIDPTSTLSRGSILGDKTRMEHLSREPNTFIRPSPTGGMLGGVARKTRETILLCEAAGFDVILVETVGTGQSEVTVRSMVDFFLLVLITGAGDELQGIKKGVMELADAIVINKADGDNMRQAEMARVETNRALHYLMPATEGWQPQTYTCSARTGEGIDALWAVVEDFMAQTRASGVFASRRAMQLRTWLHTLIEEKLKAQFFNHPTVNASLGEIENRVTAGEIPATAAAHALLQKFFTGE